jgi:hypothetical protein
MAHRTCKQSGVANRIPNLDKSLRAHDHLAHRQARCSVFFVPVPPVGARLHAFGFYVRPNQARALRPAKPCHLLDVLPH